MKSVRLLVVDFDFFFPTIDMPTGDPGHDEQLYLYDWGHREAPIFIDGLMWDVRASSFLRFDLPLPGLSGEQERFWGRFRFSSGARLYYADSNAFAYHTRVRQGVQDVLLFDAHHDSGYRPDAVAELMQRKHPVCEDWMIAYGFQDASLQMRYPAWKPYGPMIEPEPQVDVHRSIDDGAVLEGEPFSRIFVCRSGAWVPPWVEREFWDFLDRAPLRATHKHQLQDMTRREFDLPAAEASARQMKALAEQAGVPDRIIIGS